jgi:hypothetical protein
MVAENAEFTHKYQPPSNPNLPQPPTFFNHQHPSTTNIPSPPQAERVQSLSDEDD